MVYFTRKITLSMNVMRRNMSFFALSRTISKPALVGGSCVGFFSAASMVYARKQQWQHPWLPRQQFSQSAAVLAASTEPGAVSNPFQYRAARQIAGKPDKSLNGLRLTLFQFQTCPFCCKVRAYLDYRGFAYDVVEVNSVMRQELGWTKHKKVPQLVVQDAQHSATEFDVVTDSTVIISSLETLLVDKQQRLRDIQEFYPIVEDDEEKKKKQVHRNSYMIMFQEYKSTRTEKMRSQERKWRRWADDTMVHMISPNVYRTPSESLQSFEWFSETGRWQSLFPAWQERLVVYSGALVMWLVGKRLQKRHNLKDDVRLSLYGECRTWCAALPKKSPFMGGEQPDLSDLAVFGVLCSMEGCQAFRDACDNVPRLESWFAKVKEAVQANRGASQLVKYDN